MPIVTTKPASELPKPVPVTPRIIESSETIVVDAKYEPLQSLITQVDGFSWTVDYYCQLITKDTALAGQDSALPAQNQQYKLIKSLDLKVSSPLTQTQDSVTKQMTATGEAIVHSMVIPNAGDMFTAEIGDGRIGVFQIENSTQLGLTSQTVYSFRYTFVYFTDSYPSRYADLIKKVVETRHYLKDFLVHGQNPLLTTDEYDTVKKLESSYSSIVKHYFDWFYSTEYRIMLLPDPISTYYDHYVNTYMSRILDTFDDERVRWLVLKNVDDDQQLKEPQLFSALLEKDIRQLSVGYTKMGCVPCGTFNRLPTLNGIRYSGLNFIIYPSMRRDLIDTFNTKNDFKYAEEPILVPSKTIGGDFSQQIKDPILDRDGKVVVDVFPIDFSKTYVFSEAFYSGSAGMSLLEALTKDYLNGKQINPMDLDKVSSRYFYWGRLEQFYYLPIILTLIKAVVRKY
jgi:hypothetical protein